MKTEVRGLGLITDEHGVTLAEVTCGNGGDEETQRAHTALFAAAPAMLAALKDLVRYVSPGDDDSLRAMLEEGKAAIDNAEGR